MEALRKTREMRQKYEHLVDDSDNKVCVVPTRTVPYIALHLYG